MSVKLTTLLPLATVDRGETATIGCLTTNAALRARLEELGLVPGARLRVVKSGSPCILELGASRLALRVEDVDSILVTVS